MRGERGTRSPGIFGGERATPARREMRRDARNSDDAAGEPDGLLTWDEVSRTHPVRNGVYQRKGRLVSLLTDFGRINPCYPDKASADGETINYTGEGRHGDQHLSPGNRALLAAVESGHAVPLFNKLGVGRWQHTGLWRVVSAEHRFDEGERRMLWRFTLKRVGLPHRSRSRE
jgi:hypothetical protein